jgi:CRISPR-associated protein Cas1
MQQLLNTLYITTERAYAHLDHDTVRVEVDGETKLRVPLHHLGALACFGEILISPSLLARCAEDGRSVAFFSPTGRFQCRLEGPVSGNVLLRRAQHQTLDQPEKTAAIARAIVAGKIQNSRQSLLRGGREAQSEADSSRLRGAARDLSRLLLSLRQSADGSTSLATGLDQIRGFEGEAARTYFGVLDLMVRPDDRDVFRMSGRSRRPPRDRMNALLSFLYAVLLNDCRSATEGVGLDPQIGYLHTLRPGRPGLALDLMEELRPVFADRLALTLVNRRQITQGDFREREGGAVEFTDDGRKQIIVAYQKRKQDEVQHPALSEKVPLGLVPHVQARLLARHLRGDLEQYQPFVYR